MKKWIAVFLACALLTGTALAVDVVDEQDDAVLDVEAFAAAEEAVTEAEVNISAPSAILMEKETGTILYEKNAHERMEPASVTKVMTLLLIMEALDSGQIALDDVVTTSAYAASMGGSRVFLAEGEQMSVQDMIKSIAVASANDAAVAMAEHLCGTESVFVSKMNQRAEELGMTDTYFMNCTGLLDQPEHLTSAYDVAIMSRELLQHEAIKDYTTIWMDSLRDGTFDLSNTNKLIRYYEGATGLKTGYTSTARYCLAASAERDGVEYIAVVMKGETSQQRFEDAKTLLSFAFANYTLVSTTPDQVLPPVPVHLGQVGYVQPVLAETGKLLVHRSEAGGLVWDVTVEEELQAPVAAGQNMGQVEIRNQAGETLAQIPIVAGDAVEKLTLGMVFLDFIKILSTGSL